MSTPLPWYSGSAHYKLGSYKKALADFQAAYQLNPHHMHVVNNLATLHQKTGSTDSAIYYYKKALSLSPKFTAAALNLAALYYNQNQYQKALRAIRRLAYQPEHDKYKKYLTAILKARGNAIKANLTNKLIASTVHRILGTDRWLLAVYKKSLTAYTFRHQLIEDAIYALHKQEKAISLHQANTFRKKYLNND
jgi:tetratricopeptide (TPR) repeat protein